MSPVGRPRKMVMQRPGLGWAGKRGEGGPTETHTCCTNPVCMLFRAETIGFEVNARKWPKLKQDPKRKQKPKPKTKQLPP